MKVEDFVKKYNADFSSLITSVEVTDLKNKKYSYIEGINAIVEMLKKIQHSNKKIMMVGNGGSAGICSHQVVDYWKNGKIKAMAFNDFSLLTCISNDYSYAEVFSKPIEMIAEEGDMVYCISSSGKSQNILNALKAAREKKCSVVTFSGFEAGNPLRKQGDLNFYVPSFSYGFVEIMHLFIIHSILDAKMFCNDRIDVFNKNSPFV